MLKFNKKEKQNLFPIGKDAVPTLKKIKEDSIERQRKIQNAKEIALVAFLIAATTTALVANSEIVANSENISNNKIDTKENNITEQKYIDTMLQEASNKLLPSIETEDRIAYYMQNAGIKEDGSITKPNFFKYIPDEYKDIVIMLKDSNPNTVTYYLKHKISPENRIVFESEILRKREIFLSPVTNQR